MTAVDRALARALVAQQFPRWSGLPVREVAEQGNDNRSFRLGPDLLIRLPAGEWYARAVAKEQEWLPRLAPRLPLRIPEPIVQGYPGLGYPHPWSIYRWIPGETVARAENVDPAALAAALAGFLAALQHCDTAGAPTPGEHNWYRGAPLGHYAAETEEALDRLGDRPDRVALRRIWDEAMSSRWTGDPVWVHGDVAVGNLLVCDGRLAGVIDFGSSAVGDPACDLVIAWTYLDPAVRAVFRDGLALDRDTWNRAKGWALWKALITLDEQPTLAQATLSALLADVE